MALSRTSPSQCALHWSGKKNLYPMGTHGTRPDAGWEGTQEVLCLALPRSFHKHVPYQARCCTPENREEALHTQVPYSSFRLAPRKCLLIRKALEIIWENILWFYFPTARMLWNRPHCILHFTQLGEEPTELHHGSVLVGRLQGRPLGGCSLLCAMAALLKLPESQKNSARVFPSRIKKLCGTQ